MRECVRKFLSWLEMYLLLVFALVLNIVAAEDKSRSSGLDDSKRNGVATSSNPRNNVASHHNITYIDKAENMLKTPSNLNTFLEEHHKKKKKPKKSPKRTVQKIIKKKRAKLRKLYFNQRTIQTTQQPKIDYDKLYQDEKLWREETTTTQANQKKRSRKYSPKAAGYHIPFQKRQPVKDKVLRYKRGGLSRELYILKDLDEIEFLSKEDGDDVVRAHVKNIW